MLSAACATETSSIAVSDAARSEPDLPALPEVAGLADGADFVDAQPDGPAAPNYGPWTTTDLFSGLGDGGGELAMGEAIQIGLADIEAFWDRSFDEEWDFGFVPVEKAIGYDAATVAAADLPECVQGIDREFLVNAFYCFLDDTIAWDEGVLLPQLHESFGFLAPPLVLAHEYGHAIQARLGTWLDRVALNADVILELQADCHAGAWLGDLVRRGGGDLGIGAADVDRAFRSVADLGDAPGARATDFSAHGTSFDRMSAFRQGLIDGVGSCIRYVEALPPITSIGFSSSELANLGNLSMGEVLPQVVRNLALFWEAEYRATFDAEYQPPTFLPVTPGSGPSAPCPELGGDPSLVRGIATFCEGHVVVDVGELLPSLEPHGDMALSYPVIHAWSLHALVQGMGEIPAAGAVLAGDCASGAWLRGMWEQEGDLDLSAGDIDETVRSFDFYTPNNLAGQPTGEVPSLLDRVGALNRGFISGPQSCLT